MCRRGNKKGGGHRLLTLLTGFSLLLLFASVLVITGSLRRASHVDHLFIYLLHFSTLLLTDAIFTHAILNFSRNHTWPWEMSDPIMLNRLYFFGTTVQSPCHVQLSPCETSKGNCLRTQWALDGQQPSQGANLWALKATRVHDLMS